MPLVDALHQQYQTIRVNLQLAGVWEDFLDCVRVEEASATRLCTDEELWTFLVACGYAVAGVDGMNALSVCLTGEALQLSRTPRIWLEFRPQRPRIHEGDTRIDLAVGDIKLREETQAGIELDYRPGNWVCFAEMKWYADLSLDVANDIERNQLARIAENALCFQGGGDDVQKAFLVLVTPAIFRPHANPEQQRPFSRLYQYKFVEYSRSPDKAALLRDIGNCLLDRRYEANWNWTLAKDVDDMGPPA